mmetsp:Transcript_33847/g.106165  ORF Transcript_33847/g.106165 Transcript_33847/m.106165 type:complete len:344 (+) Transcript_33847:381-1412(+)
MLVALPGHLSQSRSPLRQPSPKAIPEVNLHSLVVGVESILVVPDVTWRRRHLALQHLVQEALACLSCPHEVESSVRLPLLRRLSRRDLGAVVLLVDQVAVVLHQVDGVAEEHDVDVNEEDGEAAIQELSHQLHAPPHDAVEDLAHERAFLRHARPLEQHVRPNLGVMLLHPSSYLRVSQPDHVLEPQTIRMADPMLEQVLIPLVGNHKHKHILLPVCLLGLIETSRLPSFLLQPISRLKLQFPPPPLQARGVPLISSLMLSVDEHLEEFDGGRLVDVFPLKLQGEHDLVLSFSHRRESDVPCLLDLTHDMQPRVSPFDPVDEDEQLIPPHQLGMPHHIPQRDR